MRWWVFVWGWVFGFGFLQQLGFFPMVEISNLNASALSIHQVY